MRKVAFLIPVGIGLLCAFSPVYNTHDSPTRIDDEFTNLYDQAQAEQFRVVFATPNLNDLKDNEVVIVSSGAIKMMFRVGQEIYSVNVSCVTVRR